MIVELMIVHLLTYGSQHFIAQEQETHRLPTSVEPIVESVSSNLDDKTMHELYLW